MSGKIIRLKRIFNRNSGKVVIVPLDHAVSSGPITGLDNIGRIIQEVIDGGADAIILHKGIMKRVVPYIKGNIGLITHLSASADFSPNPNKKVIVTTVEEAIKAGADAISIHINLGGKYDDFMLETLGTISREAEEWGMPLMAMMYPRGENVHDEQDVDIIKHVVRIGDELGADIIKTNYSRDERFAEVIDSCSVPVVIAGGPRVKSDIELFDVIAEAVSQGVSGVAIGRNVFQHKNPKIMVEMLVKLVHEGWSRNKVMEKLNQESFRQ